MHELSYLIRLAGIASESAEANHAKSVDTVTVAVGEMTGLVPEYLRRYWPQAVKGTILEGSALLWGNLSAETGKSIPLPFLRQLLRNDSARQRIYGSIYHN